jgi:cob(I)alamin adenosyltransferase
MGKRLTQIATRTGDDGTTGLGDNTRVSKNDLRVHAMGDVDELNSHIGLLLCEDMPDGVRTLLVEIQHQLFNLGGELSIPGFELLKPEAVLALDEALAEHNAALPGCRSSSCRPAPGPRRRPMSAEPWRAAPNAR